MEGYGPTGPLHREHSNPRGERPHRDGGPAHAGHRSASPTTGRSGCADPQVMAGYQQQPGRHRRCDQQDGWFQTGDLGDVDVDGFLHITGREEGDHRHRRGKNVFYGTRTGCRHNLIGPTMVVGEASSSLPSSRSIPMRCPRPSPAGRPAPVSELRDDPHLTARFRPRWTTPTPRSPRPSPFNMAAAGRRFHRGIRHLTPTQKFKRNVVADDYSEEIAAIYG